MHYKYLLSIIFSMVGCAVMAQSLQQGRVLEYRGTQPKTPLSQVAISASNASALMSDEKGEFTLSFRTLHAGDAIQFRRIERSGYEVMNTEALENARVANPNEKNSLNGQRSTLNIIMAPREVLRQLRDGYRSVAVKRYEQQLKLSQEEVEKLRAAGKLAEEQYNERLNALEEAYEEKLSKLESYIDKFARIDLSDLDNDEQQIIDLVQAGQFDEALSLYDKQNLADRLRRSREDQQQLVAMRDQLSAAAQQKAIENQRLRQSIERQVTLLYMAGGEENLMKVHELRHQVFLADTTHVKSRIEYATSLVQHEMREEAALILNSGIATVTDSMESGSLWLALFNCQYQSGLYKESLNSVRKADSLLYPIQDTSFVIRTRIMPIVYSYYLLNWDIIQPEECAQAVERCLKNWEPDTLNQKSVEKSSGLLTHLSDYFRRTENHEKAIWSVQEGLKIGEIMQRRWPWISIYWQNCAVASSIFAFEGMHDDVATSASNYVQLLQKYLQTWASTSMVLNVGDNSVLVLDALVMYEEYALADSLITLMDQWKVIQQLETKYPTISYELVSWYKLDVSLTLLAHGNVVEAETMAVNALDNIASTESGATYVGYFRPGTMARIRLAQGRLKEAESLYQEAIAEAIKAEDNDMASRYYVGLANVQQQQGNTKSARKALKSAKQYVAYEYNRQLINNVKI